jgi:hypothetical protein
MFSAQLNFEISHTVTWMEHGVKRMLQWLYVATGLEATSYQLEPLHMESQVIPVRTITGLRVQVSHLWLREITCGLGITSMYLRN